MENGFPESIVTFRHSRNNPLRNISRNVREAEIAALEAVGELFVVDAAEIKHRGVQVVDVHVLAVFDGFVTEFVGAAPGEAAFHAAASHPDGESQNMMVAAGALAHWGAAKFTAPYHQRVVEHAALLQVLHKCRRSFIHVHRGVGHVFRDIVVMVPRAMIKLHETRAAFDEAAGHQTIRREAAVAGMLDAVHVERGL